MRRRGRKAACLLALLLLLAAASVSLAQSQAYVSGGSADRVHLRAECSADGASMGLYFTGTPVTILGDAGSGWSAVSIGTQNGYMMTRYLSASAIMPQMPDGIVSPKNAGSRVNLRAEPSTQAAVVKTLPDGMALAVYGETKSGWYYVDAGGAQGYVSSGLVTLREAGSPGGAASAGGTASSGGARLEQTLIAQNGAERVIIELTLLSENPDEGIRNYSVRVERGGETTQAFLYATEGVSSAVETGYLTDINMDGYADLSLLRAMGAVDAFASHYLYNPQTGLFEHHEELDWLSIYRCTLYPQGNHVLNYLHDGAATGTWELGQWQDGTLVQLARASLLAPQDETFIQNLQAKVERLIFGQWQTVYDETFAFAFGDEDAWQAHYDMILKTLFEGIEPGEGRPMSEAFF